MLKIHQSDDVESKSDRNSVDDTVSEGDDSSSNEFEIVSDSDEELQQSILLGGISLAEEEDGWAQILPRKL